MGFIYLITNTVNDKCYVGQTSQTPERRLIEHLSKATRGSTGCRHLYNAIRKYGSDSFRVVQIAKAQSQEDLDRLEILWIAILNSTDKSVGYNITSGGNVEAFTEESRLRMREAQKKRHANSPPSEETKRKIKAAAIGRPGPNKGIPRSDEVKRKIRETKKRNKNARALSYILSTL